MFSKDKSPKGLGGLYKGLAACYLKIFPTNGVQFLVLDVLRAGSGSQYIAIFFQPFHLGSQVDNIPSDL